MINGSSRPSMLIIFFSFSLSFFFFGYMVSTRDYLLPATVLYLIVNTFALLDCLHIHLVCIYYFLLLIFNDRWVVGDYGRNLEALNSPSDVWIMHSGHVRHDMSR